MSFQIAAKNCDFIDSSSKFAACSVLIGKKRCSKDYDSLQGRFTRQIGDFPRVTGLLSIQVRLRSLSAMFLFYLPRFTTANHKG